MSKRLLSLVAIVVLALGSAKITRAQDDGTVVADTGFRPSVNGFGFENYGNTPGLVNLTPVEVRRLFGDVVCANIQGDVCTLTPPAQKWMDATNAAMDGGHCDGMAALSEFFYSGDLKPSDFGGDQTIVIPLQNTPNLQHEIAYWWSTQITAPYWQTLVTEKTPNEIVDILVQAIKDKSEFYTVSIRKRDNTGGHAITPYEVVDKGNGIYWIRVYDNNFPKDDTRYIEVDRNANKWTYYASTSPSVEGSLYEGDADTKTLRLKPNSTRKQKATCEFCNDQTAASMSVPGLVAATPEYNSIYLDSHSPDNKADILITDDQGHRLGTVGGKTYSEIPNAHTIETDSADLWADDPAPVYSIPVGVKFTVVVSADATLKQDQVTDVIMIGPGYDLAVEDLKLSPGDSDTFDFSPDRKKLDFTPNNTEAPDITLGVENKGADYAFTITSADVEKGATIHVNLDYNNGVLSFSAKGNKTPSTFGFVMNRIDDKSEVTYTHDGFDLAPEETVVFQFGHWDGKGDLPIGIDSKSDGTIDATQEAPNATK